MGSEPLQVLVVDDSVATRQFVTATLEADGCFAVTSIPSGFDALKLLPHSHFDLVITDINMPDINGLELLRFIRESARHAAVPVILISTDSAQRDRERGMKLGATDYLVKPFTDDDLITTARRAAKLG